jgi:hypothetical protein
MVSIGGCKKNYYTTSSSTDSVMYSPWITLQMVKDANDSNYQQNIAAKSLTQSIIDKGTILTFLQYQGQVNYASDLGVYPTFTVGNINLFTGLNATGLQFRYVLIPGKTAVTDYKSVIKNYNIPIQ